MTSLWIANQPASFANICRRWRTDLAKLSDGHRALLPASDQNYIGPALFDGNGGSRNRFGEALKTVLEKASIGNQPVRVFRCP